MPLGGMFATCDKCWCDPCECGKHRRDDCIELSKCVICNHEPCTCGIIPKVSVRLSSHEIAKEINKLVAIDKESLRIKGEHRRKAFIMHALQCKKNHTDECGWYYEIKNGRHEWSLPSHRSWFNRAIQS